MKKGFFVVIDGPRQSGKTTLCTWLQDLFDRNAIRSTILPYPTEDSAAAILSNGIEVSKKTMAVIRKDIEDRLQKSIKHYLDNDTVVIQDGSSVQWDIDYLNGCKSNSSAFLAIRSAMKPENEINPDIIVYLSASVEVLKERLTRISKSMSTTAFEECLENIQTNIDTYGGILFKAEDDPASCKCKIISFRSDELPEDILSFIIYDEIVKFMNKSNEGENNGNESQ